MGAYIMKLIAVMLASFSILVVCSAADSDQPDAIELLSQIKSNLRKEAAIRVVFRQETYSALTETATLATGTLTLKENGQLRWQYDGADAHYFIICDGRLLLIQPKDKQAFLGELEASFDQRLPLAFLFRDYPLQTHYTCTATRENGQQKGWRVDMIPVETNPQVSSIEIYARSDLTMRSVIINDQIGNKNSYFFDTAVTIVPPPEINLNVPTGFQLLDFQGEPITNRSAAE